MKEFKKKLEPFLNPTNIFIGIVVLGVILVLVLIVGGNLFRKDGPLISEGQIRIQKGDQVVIVNRNGLIEYRTGDEVFYQTWDAGKVSAFFSSIEEKVRAYLANPPPTQVAGCYQVTIYIDGEIVTVCIDPDDEELTEVFDPFDEAEDTDDIDLGDFFETPTPVGFGSSTPTPPAGGNPTATPTSGPGSPDDNYPPVDTGCEAWSGDIVGGKAIITNTLCTSSPTPTP